MVAGMTDLQKQALAGYGQIGVPEQFGQAGSVFQEVAGMTPEQRAATSARMSGNRIWAGRTHAEDTKAKISAGNKGKLAGSRSPRFGKPIPESQKLAITKATSGSNHRLAKKVLCIETGIVYDTCTAAAVAMTGNKKSRSAISKAALGKVKRLYGYTWKFI